MLIKFEQSCDPHFLPHNLAEMLGKAFPLLITPPKGWNFVSIWGKNLKVIAIFNRGCGAVAGDRLENDHTRIKKHCYCFYLTRFDVNKGPCSYENPSELIVKAAVKEFWSLTLVCVGPFTCRCLAWICLRWIRPSSRRTKMDGSQTGTDPKPDPGSQCSSDDPNDLQGILWVFQSLTMDEITTGMIV